MQSITWFEINEPAVSEAVKLSPVNWCSPNSIIRCDQFGSDTEFPVIHDEKDSKQSAGLHGITIH
jgi:hypothetical protein